MTDADIATLHNSGRSEPQVWEVTFTTSIIAMFNRMADAFEPEVPTHLIEGLEQE